MLAGLSDPASWVLLGVSPFIGSFIGVIIRRLPMGEPVAWSRSRCSHCDTFLRPADLIPIFSWMIQGGRSRFCRAPLGWFYPAVEAAAAVIAVISILADPGTMAWLDFLFGTWLLALSWIDADHYLLPDALTLPLIPVGLAVNLLLQPAEWLDPVAGIACGYAGFRAAAWLYRQWRGREGLGGGDAKLLAATGAWVGASGLASVVFGGAMIALVAAVLLALTGRTVSRETAVPFGPFLALAAWLVWLFGPLPFGVV